MKKSLAFNFNSFAVRLASRVLNKFENDLKYYDWNKGFDAEWIFTKDSVTFSTVKFNGYFHVKFTDIRPVKITKQIYNEPILLDTKITGVNTTKITNASDNITIKRGYSFAETSETNYANEIGVDVSLAIRQAISYGGELSPVKGETEITATVNTSFKHSSGGSNSRGSTINNEIDVPPKTEVTLTTQASKSNFEQKCEFWCGLEAAVEIYVNGKFRFKWSSIKDMMNTLSTNDAVNEGDNKLFDSINVLPENEINEINDQKIKDQYFDITTKFSNATNGDIKITERKI